MKREIRRKIKVRTEVRETTHAQLSPPLTTITPGIYKRKFAEEGKMTEESICASCPWS